MTTAPPAAAELATWCECGFVVPSGHPRAAAGAVLALAGDASLRAKVSSHVAGSPEVGRARRARRH